MSSGRVFLIENKIIDSVNTLAREFSVAAVLPLCGTHGINLSTAVGPVLNATTSCQQITSSFTLGAKLRGAVYCNRSCLWVCLCVGLLHDNSKLRASIFTKLGL